MTTEIGTSHLKYAIQNKKQQFYDNRNWDNSPKQSDTKQKNQFYDNIKSHLNNVTKKNQFYDNRNWNISPKISDTKQKKINSTTT